MSSRRPLERLILAAAILLLWAASAPNAAASVITTDIDSLALYSGSGMWLGHNVTVGGDVAAGGAVATGAHVNLRSIYSQSSIWLDDSAYVRGTVLANKSADADKCLDFQGPSWTGSSVCFDDHADAAGDVTARAGSISIDPSARITGNVRGNGNIWIGGGSAVYGDANPGPGKSLSTASNVTITGSRTPGSVAADTFDLPDLPTPPSHGSYGSQNVSKRSNTTTTLDAGAYKDISIGHNSTLNLSQGTYDVKDLWVDSGGTINVDTSGGDVILNADDHFDVGNNVHFNTTGDGKLVINLFNHDIWFGHDVELAGEVRVWKGDFGADYNLDLTGTIWAADKVEIGSGGRVTCGNFSSPVPEPGTIVLLAAGGLIILLRRRHYPKLQTSPGGNR